MVEEMVDQKVKDKICNFANLYLSQILTVQTWLISHGSSYADNISISMPKLSTFRNVSTWPELSYSLRDCESKASVDLCNGKTEVNYSLERPYHVVVAATREMGIGKDGNLPWNFPSDLRFFKELTTTTIGDGKRNAVIMGRTWESIPQKYQPLPGRINVVVTHARKLGAANFEYLVICNGLSSAMKLLAEPPHYMSIEKVFVIGGGEILKEALNDPGWEAIHLTDIEANIKCDTFIPQIDSSLFSPLFSSRQMVETNIQFSFMTYVRKSNAAEVSSSSQDSGCDVDSGRTVNKALNFHKNHAELDYLKRIQENIANNILK
ncbi:bifunctional dihydrofolate reductase-thymidylate synthase-like [Chenopodium quinoa]|uniref:bifunctional dihydrofolate reductase-thymidylate synthase-like n=1 Tax=Chenopodium quinoa TaxID=63459 RepID=UPI000B7750C6|nr:bifunctional dihydrofolate reductase-thymidylate synthase-like [Chenopodium quinoa]